MTELSKMGSHADCGCGGGGCNGGGGGCAKCGQECEGGPLQRPLFFSGQLLTEEDLQLLSDYAATKVRLHNRYLHGAGVVCGLQVVCHPCGEGKVIVQPGAALDCCGNDIYVPCAVELDINKMVKELRLEKRGGYDCGDPCEEPCDDSPDDVRCIERKGRRYCLYVRYCEELEEPVTPYLTGGDCALQICKPTRIHEGHKFELRCPEDDPEPDDLFRRLLCCIGDLEMAEKAADDAVAVGEFGRRYMAVREQVAQGRVDTFGEADRAELDAAAELEQFVPAGNEAAFAAAPLDESGVRASLDRYHRVASAIVRYDLQPGETRAQLNQSMEGLEATVANARRIVQQAGRPLKAEAAARLSSARARAVADAWIDQGTELTAANFSPAPGAEAQRLRYSLGVSASPEMQRIFGRDAVQLREWLLDRLENKTLASDCRLRRDLLSIEMPSPDSNQDDTLYDAERRLTEILFRYLIDCICAALNPPCQPCADPAVKLACLTVEDCEVVRICNLERTFVLSGPAIRYWVPVLHWIGELLEKACCELEVRVPEREPTTPLPPSGQLAGQPAAVPRSKGYMAATAPLVSNADMPAPLGSLLRLANIDQRSATARLNTLGSLGRLAVSGDAVTTGFGFDSRAFGDRARSAFASAAPDHKEAAAAAVAPLASDVAALRERVDAVRRETGEASESLVAPLASDVAELRERLAASRVAEEASRTAAEKEAAKSLADVRKEVTGLGKRAAADSTLVKELRKALDEQRKRSNALEARLKKLEPKKG